MDYNVTFRKKDKTLQCIISYKDEDGKWKQKSKQGFKAQKDAKSWINKTVEELEEQIELNLVIDPTLKDITFKDLCKNYISHKELYSEYNSIRNIKFAIKKFSKIDDMKVSDIRNLHAQECVDGMVKQGLKPATIKTYLSEVKTIFNYAMNPSEIIRDNPCDRIQVLVDKKDDKIKALSKNELDDLLSKIKVPKNYIASLLAGTCGLRLGEIMGLTWDNIDFKNGSMTIDKQWKRLEDKTWGFGTVKQKNSNRIIPVPPTTIKELKKYKKDCITDIHNRVILSNNGGTLSCNLERNFKRVGYNITIHDLRHTYATMLIGNGVDFKTAANLLGHDIEMTMKTYSHVNTDMMDRATLTVKNIFK